MFSPRGRLTLLFSFGIRFLDVPTEMAFAFPLRAFRWVYPLLLYYFLDGPILYAIRSNLAECNIVFVLLPAYRLVILLIRDVPSQLLRNLVASSTTHGSVYSEHCPLPLREMLPFRLPTYESTARSEDPILRQMLLDPLLNDPLERLGRISCIVPVQMWSGELVAGFKGRQDESISCATQAHHCVHRSSSTPSSLRPQTVVSFVRLTPRQPPNSNRALHSPVDRDKGIRPRMTVPGTERTT